MIKNLIPTTDCHVMAFEKAYGSSMAEPIAGMESSGGMGWLVVWNCIFRALTFHVSEPEIG